VCDVPFFKPIPTRSYTLLLLLHFLLLLLLYSHLHFLHCMKRNSNTGADVRETTRQVAFCAYTIQSKHDVTVIPDASQDFRFQNGPLVQAGPKLRFYAGAPLISPEGYKLGTFCVEGPVPRPQGLNDNEKQKLKEYGINGRASQKIA
jgi:GAF domain-containing protein